MSVSDVIYIKKHKYYRIKDISYVYGNRLLVIGFLRGLFGFKLFYYRYL